MQTEQMKEFPGMGNSFRGSADDACVFKPWVKEFMGLLVGLTLLPLAPPPSPRSKYGRLWKREVQLHHFRARWDTRQLAKAWRLWKDTYSAELVMQTLVSNLHSS